MPAKIDIEALKQALLDIGYEPRSYSGRGMYGRYCLGVSTDDSPVKLGANTVLSLIDAGEEDLAREFADLRACQDQLGLGIIVYWPQIEWSDEDTDEEE